MKFLYFTDVHLKTKTPIRRTGDFEADILGKLAFLLVTAQSRKVDAIVCGGDLFDIPNPSFRLAARVLNLISSCRIPWYQVLGNHDIMGHNPESYNMGVLAFFEHLQNFKILTQEEFDDVTLKAVHYRHGVEEMDSVWKTTNSKTIIIAHAMIVPTPVPFIHVLPSNIKTDARLILTGHYHDPWANVVLKGEFTKDEKSIFSNGLSNLLTSKEECQLDIDPVSLSKVTLFINPGSISRIAALAHNLKRVPRALLIETDEGIKITSIPLDIARPADEVFKLKEIEVEKRWEDKIEKFLAAMENVKVEGLEVATLVINTAKARAGVDNIEDIPSGQKRVLDYALKVVGQIEDKPVKREENEE